MKMPKNNYVVVSFSGGKDSTAMVLHMIEIGEHIDEIVCCDTYKEFPAMYKHIEKVKNIVECAGVKFTILRSEKTFDYLMFEHPVQRKNEKLIGNLGYSWAGPRNRWCTSKLKVDVINKYFSTISKEFNLIQCVGIAVDEGYRLERENNRAKNMRHPLVEWGWTEEQCLKYCYDKGFDWEGIYETFRKENSRCPRISCWCCPLQSIADLRILYKHFPDLWEQLKDMDKRTWRKFKANYSVEELEMRFVFEEKQINIWEE